MAVTIGLALAGRYEILYELGHGGMATVYAATDRQTGGQVAVKVMRAELAVALGAERFTREIRLTAQLRHPGIVPLLDAGVAEGLPFYTMPLVPGETLAQRLGREQQLGLEESLQIMSELLDALSHAHEAGILHRDIKPPNILLSGGRALLADFGIARAVESEGERITESGMAVGTTEYMSPEQAAADKIDQRSDLYSLGCVLYEMLAGAPPFTGASAQAVRARHARDAMPSLQTVRPTVTPRLDAVVAKVLSKVPADRYATAREFRDALRDPNLLAPDVPVKRSRISKRGIGAIGVAVLSLAAFGVWWQGSAAGGRLLDRNRVVGFPLKAPASVNGSSSAGEDVITLMGGALDRQESLRWEDGWRALTVAERELKDGVDASRMRQIARSVGAAWYLTGSILNVDDSVRVVLSLRDVATDSLVANPAASGRPTELWRVAIRSLNQLLPKLMPGTGAKDLETAWADRQPGAVASFLAGEAAFRRARPDDALKYFQDAVRVDTGFALAAVRGAQAATAAHRPAEARALLQHASGKSMPPQYVEFTKGYVAYLAGNADSAVVAFRRAVAIDGEMSAAYAQLGETYVHLVVNDPNADARADSAFGKARALDSVSTHLLLHPMEIAWRRHDAAVAAPLAKRFLLGKPDSTQAEETRLVNTCASDGPQKVLWDDAARRNIQAVLASGVVLGAHGAQLPCALAAFAAVLAVPGDATSAPLVIPVRQAALFGKFALLVAANASDSARAQVTAAVARGDGGSSILMLAATVDTALAMDAAVVAVKDSARFGADLANCSTLERCWILGAYHASLGHVLQATTIARVLNDRVAGDSTGEARLYAAAARAHALLSRGDSAAALLAFHAVVSMPFPPGAVLVWNPVGGFGLERLRLAQLLLADHQDAEAFNVAATLDAPAPAAFPLFLRASLGVRIAAATRLRQNSVVADLRARLQSLTIVSAR